MIRNYCRLGVRQFERYTNEEQRELVHRAQSGDVAARNDLVASYIPAVVSSVYDRCKRGRDEFDDCAQEALTHLMRAVECFDLSRGVPVSSYFFRTIHLTIVGFNRGRRIRGEYAKSVSLDGEMDPEVLTVVDDPSTDLLDCEYRGEVRRSAEEVLNHATGRERDVLMRHFGGESLREIGKTIGVSSERIRQIKTEGLHKIRRAFGGEDSF
jgi:RNA polymerase sigma factor (sigma-70 family)